MTKSRNIILVVAILLLATTSLKASSQKQLAMIDVTKAFSMTPLFAWVDGAGVVWNIANYMHLATGPWDVTTPVGGYCHKCGGWHR